MMRRLVPVLLLVLVLAAAAAAAEPCAPDAGTAPIAPGSQRCDERGLPGAALVTSQPTPSPSPLAAPGVVTSPFGEGGPSLVGALARLLGAVLLIAVLMAACVLGYRRLVQRTGARSGVLAWATGWAEDGGADAVRVTSRRYLGGRESVAIIHAGGERFLVGVTAGQVSLLARLESPAADPMPDFTEALARASTTVQPSTTPPASATEHLRAAVERSRERLGRLAHLSVVPRDGRG